MHDGYVRYTSQCIVPRHLALVVTRGQQETKRFCKYLNAIFHRTRMQFVKLKKKLPCASCCDRRTVHIDAKPAKPTDTTPFHPISPKTQCTTYSVIIRVIKEKLCILAGAIANATQVHGQSDVVLNDDMQLGSRLERRVLLASSCVITRIQ